MFRWMRSKYRDKREDLLDALDALAVVFVVAYLSALAEEHARSRLSLPESREKSC